MSSVQISSSEADILEKANNIRNNNIRNRLIKIDRDLVEKNHYGILFGLFVNFKATIFAYFRKSTE